MTLNCNPGKYLDHQRKVSLAIISILGANKANKALRKTHILPCFGIYQVISQMTIKVVKSLFTRTTRLPQPTTCIHRVFLTEMDNDAFSCYLPVCAVLPNFLFLLPGQTAVANIWLQMEQKSQNQAVILQQQLLLSTHNFTARTLPTATSSLTEDTK